MESPLLASPGLGALSGQSSRSRSSTKLDDVSSLTSFNPFAEEDENDQSGYTLVTNLFSRMKNTLVPLSSAVVATSNSPSNAGPSSVSGQGTEGRRPSHSGPAPSLPRTPSSDRPLGLSTAPSNPAPPLVSLTPVQSEAPYIAETDRSPSRGSMLPTPFYESPETGVFGTTIPGFPIQDDARSIKTQTGSLHRSGSVSKVIRRIRGEGLSKDYWMDDSNAKECYDCKSEFTTWRRKHHCRICGQIFCSRCASNVISGSRFGHDERIRVCNLCLEKLGKVEDDDDDDRRSIISSISTFPVHQLGSDVNGHGLIPQSPFAASQLFGRSAEPYNLFSIAETRRPISGSDSSGFLSRPITPMLREGEDGVWESVHEQAAPFRRGLSEEKDSVDIPPGFNGDFPIAPGSKTPIDGLVSFPHSNDAFASSIQFPMGSPEHLDSPRSIGMMRNRFDSYGDIEVATPFIRSRVHSRLDSLIIGEPGWRTRRESTAYAQELNLTSMHHLKIMLRQMLTIENIPNIAIWEETLLKMALKISRDVTFTSLSHRQGEDMDVRRYVKIKKLPGGSPFDSEYVDGVVITKNVAHKQMSRFQRNARIMLVTFPLEFQRVEGQYMHFGQIFRQEKEYLGNLASRIAALRPHVVLVEKSVSRLALDALAKHNVAVARAVKPSVIQTVARMTQADIFSSMDKLALEPRLGHCSKYRIQSFDHALIPGRRKTYMRFEGCNKDLGCTIILRGETIDTLRRIKKVARFLTFVVRNLKLETHLWKDSVITLPALTAEAALASSTADSATHATPASTLSIVVASSDKALPSGNAPPSEEHDDLPDEDAEQLRLSNRIRQSIEPYNNTFISVSSTLRFPPPYPIRRMKELEDELMDAKRSWEDEIVRRDEMSQRNGHESLRTPVPANPPPPPTAKSTDIVEADSDDIKAQIEALPTANLASTPSPTAKDVPDEYFFSNVGHTLTLPHAGGIVASPNPMDAPPIKTAADISVESQLSFVQWQHVEQRRIWEWYLRKNKDDFVVEKYQCICLREFVIPMTEAGLDRACFPPQLKYITFYGEGDCTLGQFIEKAVAETLVQFLDPKAICSGKGCDQPKARHCRVYVHNESRLFVAVEQWDGQIVGRYSHAPSPDLITTWSACRVCGSATPFIPVSEEMQCYSFAKFLELHFYPADVKIVQGAGCNHNIYRHHVRYFAAKGMTIRFQADPIALYEVVYPSMRVRVRPETQLELKNSEYDRLLNRNTLWYNALIDDLRLIRIDAATGDEETDNRLSSDIQILINRAEAERESLEHLIYQIYRESPPTDTLALNQVHAIRQDKIVAWQQDFDKLPKPKAWVQPVEKAGKRASTFGSVRAMWPKMTYDYHIPSSSVSEAEEYGSNMRRTTGDSLTSSASEASEPEQEPETSLECSDKEAPPDLPKEPTDLPIVSKGISEDPDPDSDSTIEAVQEQEAGKPEEVSVPSTTTQESDTPAGKALSRVSKLPRRSAVQPSVADLVKKYQDFLPSQGVQELAKTALAPPPHPLVSESEQEYPSPQVRRTSRKLNRTNAAPRGQPTSDFESGYAANIAPRYLASARRPLPKNSRIPAPVGPRLDSQESSRRSSPEKNPSKARSISPRGSRIVSNPVNKVKGKLSGPSRVSYRDNKPTNRPPERNSRSTFRRPPGTPGAKVSNIAKHFERLGRDAERMNRRYAVIRGKRARPVASARAKVEVLESVKDAINDSGDDSDSSEADDEGGGDEDERLIIPPMDSKISPLILPEPLHAGLPAITVDSASATQSPAVIPTALDPEGTAESEQKLVPLPEDQPGTEVAPAVPPSPHPQPAPGPISLPPSPFLTSFKLTQNLSLTPPPSDYDAGHITAERNSILKAISGLWLQQPSIRGSVELDELMNDPEHIFRDSSMIVRIDEPTSIIALALNSPQYRELLLKSRVEKRTAREPKLTESGEAFMPDDRSIAESTSTWGVVNIDAGDMADPTEDLKTASSKLPWAISFESGGLAISCTVLYPEQFDALRRTYDCEKSMIESLARCIKWNANGGKSGSAFLKTLDDRFIAKELSRPELQAMETFAPAYFDYMSSAVYANRPVLLAKVLGCYKLTFKQLARDKSPGRPKSTQMNLLVMENLFYDRRFAKIYDLKGSTRNRHVQSTGRENEVLLDENLNQNSHQNPFYLREHSKRILRGALYNDTKFLEDINVMDYSLVVGVDSVKNELVAGIVDYIRTYTWDKKLESLVKDSTFLGTAAKGEPTIVTPKLYRQRFLTAMERYFPLVPDRWMKQRDAPEEEHVATEPTIDW